MDVLAEIRKYETDIAYWRDEVLKPFEESRKIPQYHKIGITDLSQGWENPPQHVQSAARAVLGELSGLEWKLAREACPETDWLLERLKGAGRGSAVAMFIMAGVRGLIDDNRSYEIDSRIEELTATKYFDEFVKIYQAIIRVQEEYVALARYSLALK